MQRPCVNPPRAEQRAPVEPEHPMRTVPVATAASVRCARGTVLALLMAPLLALLAACSSPPSQPANPVRAQVEAHSQTAARALRRGDLASALAAYQVALAAAESIEDFESTATALLNLAAVHSQLGQADAANVRLDRILNTPAHFSVSAQAHAAARKALVQVDQGQLAQALQWADRSQALCPSACALAPALNNLRAHVAWAQGDMPGAAAWATRATEQAAAASLPAEHANGLRMAGRAESHLGNHDRAAALLAQALQLDQALGLSDRIASDLQFAAENETRRGQPAAARAFLERALVVRQAMGDTSRTQALRQQLQQLATSTPR